MPGCADLSATGIALASSRHASQVYEPNADTLPGPLRGFVQRGVLHRALLRRMVVGQLARDDHRARRHEHALDVLAAHAQEVVVGDAVVEVDAALVAALDERGRGQRGRRSRRADDDRVGLRADELQRLARPRSCPSARSARWRPAGCCAPSPPCRSRRRTPRRAHRRSRCSRASSRRCSPRARGWRSAIITSVCGVLNDHAFLASTGSMMRADDASEMTGVSRVGEHVDHRQRVGRRGRADDGVDLALADQLAGVLHGGGGVGRVVEHDVLDRSCRATVFGHIGIVLRSGMPSDAAGPVADTVTPIFTCAVADAATSASARERRATRTTLCRPRARGDPASLTCMPASIGSRSIGAVRAF